MTHLIDVDGNEVHRRDHNGFPSVVLDPKLTGGQLGHILLRRSPTAAKRGVASASPLPDGHWRRVIVITIIFMNPLRCVGRAMRFLDTAPRANTVAKPDYDNILYRQTG